MRGLVGLPSTGKSSDGAASAAGERLQFVLALITDDERSSLQRVMDEIPAEVLADAEKRLVTIAPDQAVAWLRAFILPKAGEARGVEGRLDSRTGGGARRCPSLRTTTATPREQTDGLRGCRTR